MVTKTAGHQLQDVLSIFIVLDDCSVLDQTKEAKKKPALDGPIKQKSKES